MPYETILTANNLFKIRRTLGIRVYEILNTKCSLGLILPNLYTGVIHRAFNNSL